MDSGNRLRVAVAKLNALVALIDLATVGRFEGDEQRRSFEHAEKVRSVAHAWRTDWEATLEHPDAILNLDRLADEADAALAHLAQIGFWREVRGLTSDRLPELYG